MFRSTMEWSCFCSKPTGIWLAGKLLLVWIVFAITTQSLAQELGEFNYDESKIAPYTLPELLRTSGKKLISNTTDWEKIRRPEILRLFENNIFGQMPALKLPVRSRIVQENAEAMNGRATLKEITIEAFNNNQSVQIHLILFIPNKSGKPAPVFVLINNREKENTDPTRRIKSDFWPAEILIDSGYAVAAFHVIDLAPDDKQHFTDLLLQLYPEQLTLANGMRAIGAWAWGASRVMDYLETDSGINPKQVAIVGHSRGGKASLWAAAQDQRFAMCISNCSGNTGAALARRKFGERIRTINTSFPHWFTDNYKKFNDNEDSLPVDQHMLIALMAPRPVYATSASKDLWADPMGTFLALKHAEAVYALYHLRSLLPTAPPAINQAITASPVAYHNREGVHDLTVFDWISFIRFANYHYHR